MTPQPVKADCIKGPPASYHGGPRPVSTIEWIVLHSTEDDASAMAIARYFASANAKGSAHLTVDDASCVRSLPNGIIAYGAPGANLTGFHIEQCGFASWSKAQWLEHDVMLHRTAFKTAYHAHLFKLPLIYRDAAALKAGKKGVTTHMQVSLAFPNDLGNHHDPGTAYPLGYVLGLAKQYFTVLAGV